ncbi:hypothetical protein MLD38_038607 [Melastoma candidum]|uniref:Uncharacterized protein n=1 Tax=Melastoma candidum TaxID=119954 RepID=A0ACB9KZF2_9MYRT|nr:hypothetical protein MLD38_038607 [Melastoma candidum]
MDEGLDDEVTPLDASECLLLQGKEGGLSLKSENGSFVDHRGSSSDGLANILESRNANRSIHSLENESMDPHPADDFGGMVEELMVRNIDDLNMAIVGTSKGTDRTRTRAQCWPLLHKMSNSRGLPVEKEDGHDVSRMWEDIAGPSISEMLSHKPLGDNQTDGGEESPRPDLNNAGDASVVGAMRTKMLSKSGFSEFFNKHTLKGKGVIQRDVPRDRISVQTQADNNVHTDTGPKLISNEVVTPATVRVLPRVNKVTDPNVLGNAEDGVNLGEWLRDGKNDIDKMEKLNLFRQIVNFVDSHHSRGIAIQMLRPSFFKLMPSNQVRYIGPGENTGNVREKHVLGSGDQMSLKRTRDHCQHGPFSSSAKKRKSDASLYRGSQWHGLRLTSQLNADSTSGNSSWTTNQTYSIFMHGTEKPSYDRASLKNGNSPSFNTHSVSQQLEEKWYSVPEGCNGGENKLASDIYCLGVILFELLGRFDSVKARSASMMDLHRRIFPPNFLSENPREVGFCLWLLHPDPSSRPSTRDVLQSDVLNGLKDVCSEELSSIIEQDDAESDLLLHFLVTSKEQKQRSASKLVEDLKCLEADIQEIAKRRVTGCSGHPCPSMGLLDARGDKLHDKQLSNLHFVCQLSVASDVNKSRLQGNMDRLETAYFSLRSRIQTLESDVTGRTDCDVLRSHDNSSSIDNDEESSSFMDQTGAFFDGLCKYARYTKFKVRGVLRSGEFNNSANVICSLSFNRDQDYLAAAGVSKKIKIYEFDALLNQSVDIHYPAVEMSNRSRLSCVCWNNYIRNYLASSDYDGIVKLWDVTTGQVFSEYREHEKRAWSVDFSPVCPTKFASGSDDCTVKLWSINERNRVATIRNIANVCSVQFSAHSAHLLAFGSADYLTYCYDLRNARSPWCILTGHEKAVSYVKFLDSQNVVTASTDNTLKLWDLTRSSPNKALSHGACCLTFRGHTNEKNFVGLSAANGFITCGSETNEVFTYYRSLPMPITSLKFGSIDQISGKETNDDNGQFVSSVCWRRKSDMLIAANSSGCIKVLEMA